MGVDWLYPRLVCTGLGDRLGTILALSALASLHNSSYVVHMEWCTDPMRVDPLHLAYIPGWTGWDYPLETLHSTLTLPPNVRLFLMGRTPSKPAPALVTEGGSVPIWDGLMHTNTMFCRAMGMGETGTAWSTRECETAYRKAGAHLLSSSSHPALDLPYILVHFRGANSNTVAGDESSFCTQAVLRRLHAEKVYMKVISNNHSLSMQWMRGLPSVHLVHSSSAFQDMVLALSAVAIVQHATAGWSSYTSVPAMARGIPLINTFTGSNHRFDLFSRHGKVPREFYRCSETAAFVLDAVTAWKQAGQPAFLRAN